MKGQYAGDLWTTRRFMKDLVDKVWRPIREKDISVAASQEIPEKGIIWTRPPEGCHAGVVHSRKGD